MRSLVAHCQHVYRGYAHLHQKSPESSGWTHPINVPNCVISHLNILEFRGYQGSTEEHAFTAYILQRGLVLKTMTIHTDVFFDQKKKDHILKELSIIPRGSSICQLKLDWPISIYLRYGAWPLLSVADCIKAVLSCMELHVFFVVCLTNSINCENWIHGQFYVSLLTWIPQLFVESFEIRFTNSQILSSLLWCPGHGETGTSTQ